MNTNTRAFIAPKRTASHRRCSSTGIEDKRHNNNNISVPPDRSLSPEMHPHRNKEALGNTKDNSGRANTYNELTSPTAWLCRSKDQKPQASWFSFASYSRQEKSHGIDAKSDADDRNASTWRQRATRKMLSQVQSDDDDCTDMKHEDNVEEQRQNLDDKDFDFHEDNNLLEEYHHSNGVDRMKPSDKLPPSNRAGQPRMKQQPQPQRHHIRPPAETTRDFSPNSSRGGVGDDREFVPDVIVAPIPPPGYRYPSVQSHQESSQLQSCLRSGANGAHHSHKNPEVTAVHSASSEARIVAPHVAKLSPSSCIEIRLQSDVECAAVLCSVDVLKMRSEYFQDLLADQERSGGGFGSSNTADMIWRLPLSISDSTPFEAAAFLESLHEGRALFKNEWNYAWVKLSVYWRVTELMLEFSSQIERHMEKLVSYFQDKHWRCNPNCLVGFRVAIFRKNAGNAPTVAMGTVVESAASTTHSKLRVSFDNPVDFHTTNTVATTLSTTATTGQSTVDGIPLSNSIPSPFASQFRGAGGAGKVSTNFVIPPTTPRRHSNTPQKWAGAGGKNGVSEQVQTSNAGLSSTSLYSGVRIGTPRLKESHHSNFPSGSHLSSEHYSENLRHQIIYQEHDFTQAIVADVAEPFWIQDPTRDNASWCEPDDHFIQDAKRVISAQDKKVFWEMARCIIELPDLCAQLNKGIRSASELTSMLRKQEYRFLWTYEGPEHLPKDAATDLIRAAYVSTPSVNV